jgi:hypothetical protein
MRNFMKIFWLIFGLIIIIGGFFVFWYTFWLPYTLNSTPERKTDIQDSSININLESSYASDLNTSKNETTLINNDNLSSSQVSYDEELGRKITQFDNETSESESDESKNIDLPGTRGAFEEFSNAYSF